MGPEVSLGRSAARGAAVTLAGQIVRLALQALGIVLLARLLSPTTFGLVAMVTTITGVAEVLRDFGLSTAAIQARTLSAGQRDKLFWINSGIGLLLSGLVFIGAPVIAAIYSQGDLIVIAQSLAIVYLINGMATQYRAGLVREMRYSALAIVDTVASATSISVAVIIALTSDSVWALVWQQISLSLVTLVSLAAIAKWIPSLRKGDDSVAHLTKFGLTLGLTQLIGYGSRNVDSLAVGNAFGPSVLGLYNRAFQLLMLPLNQITAPLTSVALPTLGRLRDDPRRFVAYLARAQKTLVYAGLIIFGLSIVNADALISVVLGGEWASAAPIFQILCIGGLFQIAAYSNYWVFLVKGLTASNLIWALISRTGHVVLIVAGVEWGVLGVAAGYSLGLLLIWPLETMWVQRVAEIDLIGILGSTARSITFFLPGVFGGLWVAGGLSGANPFASLLLASLAFFGLLCVSSITKSFRVDVRDLLLTVQLLGSGGLRRGKRTVQASEEGMA